MNPLSHVVDERLCRLAVTNGYTADARWWAEVDGDDPIGYIPRQASLPYGHGPSHPVWSWRGVPVIHVETAHRRYVTYQVPRQLIVSHDLSGT